MCNSPEHTVAAGSNTSRMATLLARLRKETNGAVVEAMTARGIRYPLSYGVSVPAIREICTAYAPDHSLARLLYRQEVRELRLAGIFVAESALVTPDELDFWAQGVINTEVGEHLAHALLGRSPVAETVMSKWLGRKYRFPVTGKTFGSHSLAQGGGDHDPNALRPAVSATPNDNLLCYTALLTGARALMLGNGPGWDYDRIFGSLASLLADGDRMLWPAAAAFSDRVIGKIPEGKGYVSALLADLGHSAAPCRSYLNEELGWQLE